MLCERYSPSVVTLIVRDRLYCAIPTLEDRAASEGKMSSQVLRLNAFRGEPASSGFEWHFTPNHNSSADSSTSVGSDLHLVSPKLHPGHG
ncbi:hypothetical protein MLD38_030915 [Melastoma candidum]|uniref:Uncharacterized protein n=1 Tax=Melastoma candidum TaxID=119954 RepID=A0ACB9MMK3_9MYRT|nr:hypothetical protein MLD38_030915 [Melastoma candidum]